MTAISCQTGVELLMDYLEGVVPDDMRTILESHVAGCPKCEAFRRLVPGDASHPA
jgi:anti-sigma factor RsiW